MTAALPSDAEQVLDRLALECSPGSLPRALGSPPLRGLIRAQPEDFQVDEALGIQPEGQGEHLLLRVRKLGQNTTWVAGQLARWAKIPSRDVGFAGRKDRHALTTQWFSLRLPHRRSPGPPWPSLPGVEVLEHVWHRKRLRPGVSISNRFVIRVREVRGSHSQTNQRLERMAAAGIPNYFGEQRFGRGASNLYGSIRSGKRSARSLTISALRSALFNVYAAGRVAAGDWSELLEGEVPFHDADGLSRLGAPSPERSHARICGSGPLWGTGASASRGLALDRERECVARWSSVAHRLERAGVQLSRRALVSWPSALRHSWEDDTLWLSFQLARGQFATALLRELVDYSDLAREA